MPRAFLVATALVVFFALIPACSAQKDADYEGEPLVVLRGNVVLGADAIPPAVHVMLGWDNFTRQGDIVSSEAATVRGSFPARFRLDVLRPPEPHVFNDFGHQGLHPNEVPLAVANIVALETPGPQGPLDSTAIGIVEDYVLVYMPEPVRPNTATANVLHGTLSQGFHLMKVVRFSPEEKQAMLAEREACYRTRAGEDNWAVRVACGSDYIYDELHEVPIGTEVTLKLAAGKSLDWPNYH
ncbi:hypothetical protein LVJ94_39280 [Pendulispora rubella]|uniref:Uncharacterized protein n=1 Tax=Pendulispora rubella TaxID=2741070 RepID=A0ABZ2KYV0_9BACT